MIDRFRFRAWNIKAKEMIYNAEIAYDGTNYSTEWQIGENNNDGWIYCFADYLSREEEYRVMHCTGLKDKNGRLIYEGDIVLFRSAFDKKAFFAEIKFGKAEGYECFFPKWHGKYIEETKYNPGWRKDIHYWIEQKIEVVGNIHENPELLEQTNER